MNNDHKPSDNISQERQAQRQLMRKSTWIILIGISLALFATYYVIQQSPSIRDYYVSKEKHDKDPHLILRAFVKTQQNQYQEVSQPVQVGNEVIFKISTVNSVYVAMAKSVNDEQAHVVFHSRIPPGENRMFEKAGTKYTYTIQATDQSLRFCLLYAEDRNQLTQRVQLLDKLWRSIPEAACQQLR